MAIRFFAIDVVFERERERENGETVVGSAVDFITCVYEWRRVCERDGLTTFKRIETVIASERQRLKEQSVCAC